MAAHAQSSLLATCGADTTVQLFDVQQARQVASLTGEAEGACGVLRHAPLSGLA
jgi:hypothetical protein